MSNTSIATHIKVKNGNEITSEQIRQVIMDRAN